MTEPYHLKTARARGHLNALKTEITAFFETQPYEVYVEASPDTEGQFHWKVKVKAQVPEDWSGLIGDAIHNARSALDLLAVAVIKRCEPERERYKRAYFPFGQSREAFEANLRNACRGANRTARDLFSDTRAYKGGNETLWRLHALDILDKHRAIIPVGAAYSFLRMNIDPKKDFPDLEWMQKAPSWTLDLKPADRLFPLRDGETLFVGPAPSGSFGEPSFGFDVAFGEGEILDGEPVISGIEQMFDEVDRVIADFEGKMLA